MAGQTAVDDPGWGVLLATGGCAFRLGLIGSSYNNTGDGHLMAAEAGAGLRLGVQRGLFALAGVALHALPYQAARFFDAAGAELDISLPNARPAAKAKTDSKMVQQALAPLNGK